MSAFSINLNLCKLLTSTNYFLRESYNYFYVLCTEPVPLYPCLIDQGRLYQVIHPFHMPVELSGELSFTKMLVTVCTVVLLIQALASFNLYHSCYNFLPWNIMPIIPIIPHWFLLLYLILTCHLLVQTTVILAGRLLSKSAFVVWLHLRWVKISSSASDFVVNFSFLLYIWSCSHFSSRQKQTDFFSTVNINTKYCPFVSIPVAPLRDPLGALLCPGHFFDLKGVLDVSDEEGFGSYDSFFV